MRCRVLYHECRYNDGLSTTAVVLIVVGSVGGVIIIAIAIILIIRCLKKPNVEQETKSLNKDDKLLQDI